MAYVAAMACWWDRKMVEATVSAGKVGAGAGASGAGEKSQGDSHGVKASGRRTRRPGIARGDSG